MRAIILGLILCAGCAHSARTPSSSATASYPFRATEHNIFGAITEDLIGTAYVGNDEIRIVVTQGLTTLKPTPTRQPISLSAGLAYCQSAGRWVFRSESSRIPVERINLKGDTLAAALEFGLVGTSGIDLGTHWIAIQQHSRILLNSETGQWREVTRAIHSQPFVFHSDSTKRVSLHARCIGGR